LYNNSESIPLSFCKESSHAQSRWLESMFGHFYGFIGSPGR
jgi:hypothetical protein